MELLNSLIEYDKQLLLFLHSLGCTTFDNFWLIITNPLYWIPLIFYLFFLAYKTLGLKNSILTSLFTAVAGILSLGIVNVVKNAVKRIRPINDTSINDSIRTLIDPSDYSFVSGHSTVSFVVAFLSFWILRKQYNFAFLIFLFPIFFTYSRIYLAAHFPMDIFAGMLLGFIISLSFYKLIQFFISK